MVSSMTQHEWEALGEAEAAFAPEGEWEGALEGEWETELENEWESEFESPGDARQVALEAAKSESEQEAVESFLPLVPMLAGKILPLAAKMASRLAGKIIPRMARHVTRVSPTLSRGISGIARKLYRNPGTRSLLRAVPSIAQRTMRRIAHQAAVGRPITERSVLRTLAQQTYRVLSHPGARSRALRRRHGHSGHRDGLAPAARHVARHVATAWRVPVLRRAGGRARRGRTAARALRVQPVQVHGVIEETCDGTRGGRAQEP
jgi:hypothetical protein